MSGDTSRAAAAADIPASKITTAIIGRFKEASYIKEALSVGMRYVARAPVQENGNIVIAVASHSHEQAAISRCQLSVAFES